MGRPPPVLRARRAAPARVAAATLLVIFACAVALAAAQPQPQVRAREGDVPEARRAARRSTATRMAPPATTRAQSTRKRSPTATLGTWSTMSGASADKTATSARTRAKTATDTDSETETEIATPDPWRRALLPVPPTPTSTSEPPSAPPEDGRERRPIIIQPEPSPGPTTTGGVPPPTTTDPGARIIIVPGISETTFELRTHDNGFTRVGGIRFTIPTPSTSSPPLPSEPAAPISGGSNGSDSGRGIIRIPGVQESAGGGREPAPSVSSSLAALPTALPLPDAAPQCGDGICSVSESCAACPQDCSLTIDLPLSPLGSASRKLLQIDCASPLYTTSCVRRPEASQGTSNTTTAASLTWVLAIRGNHPGPQTARVLDTLQQLGVRNNVIWFLDPVRTAWPAGFSPLLSSPQGAEAALNTSAVEQLVTRIRNLGGTIGWQLPFHPVSRALLHHVAKRLHPRYAGANAQSLLLLAAPHANIPLPKSTLPLPRGARFVVPNLPTFDGLRVLSMDPAAEIPPMVAASVGRHTGVPGWIVEVAADTQRAVDVMLPRIITELRKAGARDAVSLSECFFGSDNAAAELAVSQGIGNEAVDTATDAAVIQVQSLDEAWAVSGVFGDAEDVSEEERRQVRELGVL